MFESPKKAQIQDIKQDSPSPFKSNYMDSNINQSKILNLNK